MQHLALVTYGLRQDYVYVILPYLYMLCLIVKILRELFLFNNCDLDKFVDGNRLAVG